MGDTINFVIAVGAALLGGASLVLHVVAPRTKNKWDDALRDDFDEILGFVRAQKSALQLSVAQKDGAL